MAISPNVNQKHPFLLITPYTNGEEDHTKEQGALSFLPF